MIDDKYIKELEDKVAYLEKIMSLLDEGILMTDENHVIRIMNPAMEKMEGLSANKTIGKHIWEAYGYVDKETSEHKRVFDSGEPILNKYNSHTFRDDVPMYTIYSSYPIADEDRKYGVVSIAKNETLMRDLLFETIELKRKLYNEKDVDGSSINSGAKFRFNNIIGNSSEMKTLIREAQSLAETESPILIVGETGTGKEVFAQSIHNYTREKKKFVAINCAAIPENLLESILFGTTKGSYTGAVDNVGLFEEAGEGTLFLDEINSMSEMMQAKLLRVLQEKKVRPVGSTTTKDVNCRVISATNEDPVVLINEGRMRKDLFYRLSGYCLYIKPLRDRRDDILSTTDFYVNILNAKMNKHVKGLDKKLEKMFIDYYWPGNVRELEHTVNTLMLKASGSLLKAEAMPDYLRRIMSQGRGHDYEANKEDSLPEVLNGLEKKLILEALEENGWNYSKSAKSLGIIRQSLMYRMKKLNIDEKNSK